MKTPKGDSQVPGPMSALSTDKTTHINGNAKDSQNLPLINSDASCRPSPENSAPDQEKKLLLTIMGIILGVGLIVGGIIIFASYSNSTDDSLSLTDNYVSPQEALRLELEQQTLENVIVNPYLEVGTLKAESQQRLVADLGQIIPSEAIQITDRVAKGVAMIKPTAFYFVADNISAEEFSLIMLNSLPDGWTIIDNACNLVEEKAGLTNLYNAATVFTNAAAAQSCPNLVASPSGETYAIWAYSNADSNKILDPDFTEIDGSNPGNVGLILPDTGVLIVASSMDLNEGNTKDQTQMTPEEPSLDPQASP